MEAVVVVYQSEKGLPRNSGSMESYRACRLLLGNLETWTKSSYGLGSSKFIGWKQLLPTSRIHLGASNKGFLHGAITCWSALCADLKQLGGPTSDSSIPHHHSARDHTKPQLRPQWRWQHDNQKCPNKHYHSRAWCGAEIHAPSIRALNAARVKVDVPRPTHAKTALLLAENVSLSRCRRVRRARSRGRESRRVGAAPTGRSPFHCAPNRVLALRSTSMKTTKRQVRLHQAHLPETMNGKHTSRVCR